MSYFKGSFNWCEFSCFYPLLNYLVRVALLKQFTNLWPPFPLPGWHETTILSGIPTGRAGRRHLLHIRNIDQSRQGPYRHRNRPVVQSTHHIGQFAAEAAIIRPSFALWRFQCPYSAASQIGPEDHHQGLFWTGRVQQRWGRFARAQTSLPRQRTPEIGQHWPQEYSQGTN